MKKEVKIIILKQLMLNFSQMVVKYTREDLRQELFYIYAKNIEKHLLKWKPQKINANEKDKVNKLFEKCIDFSNDFFEGKDKIPAIPMLLILDYLVNELKDTSLRVHFLHLPYAKIRSELYQSEILKESNKQTNRYLTGIIEILGLENE